MTPSSSQGQFCHLCGAWRGQFGLEPTPEMYVAHLLQFMRQVWRVLRKDGTFWLNIGDSYAGSWSDSGHRPERSGVPGYQRVKNTEWFERRGHPQMNIPPTAAVTKYTDLKPKDLVMIPFRVALAAQADGWSVRSDIIWNKPNPMPESVTDRPTKSHEYIFLLAKSHTSQYWTHRDHNGTRTKPKPDYRWVNQLTEEELDYAPPDWKKKVTCPKCQGSKRITVTVDVMGSEASWDDDCDFCVDSKGRPKGKVQLWERINLWQGHDYYYDADAIREPHKEPERGLKPKLETSNPHAWDNLQKGSTWVPAVRQYNPSGRNKRTVWTVSTKPFPGAHFATFPPDLIEPMILAGSPPKCCAECGAPWERVVDRSKSNWQERRQAGAEMRAGDSDVYQNAIHGQGMSHDLDPPMISTIGWRPTCQHDATKTVPARVLDLFAGTGTVAEKCIELGRDYTLIEIMGKYLPMIEESVSNVQVKMPI